jgi:hypothetical protein
MGAFSSGLMARRISITAAQARHQILGLGHDNNTTQTYLRIRALNFDKPSKFECEMRNLPM